MQKNRVSALVPAWQAAEFIQPTLDSLSSQSYDNLDFIVSVDFSEDDTYGVCMTHSKRDPRFRVVRQNCQLGYVGNCNFLLGQTDATYAFFAFHDDVIHPDYVARLAAVLDNRPKVVCSFSDVSLTHVNGRKEHWEFSELEGVNDRVQRGTVMLAGDNKWWVPNRGLFRHQQALKIQGLKIHDAGEFSADWPWLFHMSLLGEFARVPATLCYKYYKLGSLSRSWEYSSEQFFEVWAACMRELWNSELSSAEKLVLASTLANKMIKNRQEQSSTP